MLLRCIGGSGGGGDDDGGDGGGGDGDSDGDSGGGGGGDGDGGSNPVLGARVTLIPASMLFSSSTRSFVTSAIVVRTSATGVLPPFSTISSPSCILLESNRDSKYDSRYRFKYSFLASLCALYAPFTFLCNV